MKTSLALGFVALMMTPALALAAGKKSAPATEQTVTSPSNSSLTSASLGAASLKGLSFFGAYDLTDSVTVSQTNSVTANMDKTFLLGAEYTFPQFSKGLALQVGDDYEFARSIQNSGGAQLSTWLPFAELALQVSPAFAVMGGMNYGFPSLSNANGATIAGKIGFQFGGSFLVAPNLAIDGRYRAINDTLTVGTTTADVKMSGFLLDGRFLF